MIYIAALQKHEKGHFKHTFVANRNAQFETRAGGGKSPAAWAWPAVCARRLRGVAVEHMAVV